MRSVWPGAHPPPKTARTAFEDDPPEYLESVKLPKSAAFPNVDIVIKLIASSIGLGLPPAIIPRVGDAAPIAPVASEYAKSPKSVAFASDDMVTYCIVLVSLGFPPANIPRVSLLNPACSEVFATRLPKLTCISR